MQAFLFQLSRSPSVVEAAIADNCRFDERISAERWQAFAKKLPDPTHIANFGDWQEASKLYYEKRVTVPSLTVPDTFMPMNQGVWLKDLGPNQTLVRLESLEWPLKEIWNVPQKKWDEYLKQLTNQLNARDSDSRKAVEQQLDDWNKARDNRPGFAAFLDEVKSEAEATNWPDQLRDRLGLGHYNPSSTQPIPVALMRYSLDEVLQNQKRLGWPAALALPTALDGGMHQFFFPVPKGHPYGATLHLAADRGDSLTAEILHARLDYQAKHLWKLGWIRAPHRYPEEKASSAAPLRQARDLHLLALRVESGREDFGEDMEGRS